MASGPRIEKLAWIDNRASGSPDSHGHRARRERLPVSTRALSSHLRAIRSDSHACCPTARAGGRAAPARHVPKLLDTWRAMSQNVEIVRRAVEAWNERDAGSWLTYASPEIEWLPAGPAAVERAVYRGYDEVASGFESVWQTWERFQFEEFEIRDLGESVLWLGRLKMTGAASHVELDQEFAFWFALGAGKLARVQAFLAWAEALQAAGLDE